MKPDHDNHYYAVVCSSGDRFYTRARTSLEFVLDPAFFQFILLSIILFTSLMIALEMPAIPQVILFGAGVASTCVLLTISITVYVGILKLTGFRTVYTPLLLFPMQVANTFAIDHMLRLFGTSYIDGFNGFWEISLRTLIIIVCLDIIHAKFVAPHHGYTVKLDEDGNVISKDASLAVQPLGQAPKLPSLAPHFEGKTSIEPNPTEVDTSSENVMAAVETAELPVATQTNQPNLKRELRIGRETFDLETIQYIKSEDHYLVVQNATESAMVRGRLREIAAKIEAPWGLQINRSFWVAYAAIAKIEETAKGQLNILLRDGSKIRVANSRKIFFENGCNQYAPKVVWSRVVDGQQ